MAIQLRLRYSQSLKPCELQKPIPNHQSSFCWICLPLLTLSIIRSSCPPSHHWTSLGFNFAGLNPISLVFPGGLGRGGIQSTSIGHWGSPGIGSWTPPLLHIHYITGSHHTGIWLLLPFPCWWHTALSLISTRWSNGSCTDLRLPGRHLSMDERKSPTAQPGKDWASCLPCHSNSTAWLHDSVRFINNYSISFGQKSWSNLWWPADLQRAHCKDCSILQVCTTQHQKDQALSDRACCTTSCPGPCHLQAGLLQCASGWTSIKHNQTSINDSECSGMTGLQWAQVTPLFVSLHWLPVAARIQFKTLMLAYRTTSSAPTYFHSLLQIYCTSPPEVWDLLVSDTSWYHHREVQNHSPEHSHLPFLAGGMIFPPPSGMLDPCQYSSNN